MHFINPYFLFALSAIAIPIMVHLFNFRRYKKVYFSNTGFLKELIEESNNAQKIKRLIILLARCLAIIFLVFAFAQPFIPKGDQIKKGKTVVSIFVDNSFSMQSLSTDRTLLEKAKLFAIEIAQSFDNDVSFQLITQDMNGKQQRILSKDDFMDQVKNIQVSASSHSLDELKKRQLDAMTIENFDVKKLYYISDFQKNLGTIPTDELQDYNFIQVESNNQKNIFIDSAWLENPISIVGQNNKILVKINNESNEDIEKLRVNMQLNGQKKAISDFNINAHSYIIDTLYFNQSISEWNNVSISLEDFPIEFDNTYFLSFYVYSTINLLNLDNQGSNRYISALVSFSKYFNTTQSSISQIDYSLFDKQQLIILSNVNEISSGLQSELKKYIEKGGHLALFPTKDANLLSLNQLLTSLNIASFTTKNEQLKEVKSINTNSSLLGDIFDNKLQQNMTLPKSSYSYSTNSLLSNSEKIMTFSDGQSFMTQYNISKGRVYLFTVPLDASICDLPIQAIFAPLLFKMAVDGHVINDIQYTIGAKKSIPITTDSKIQLNSENMLYVSGNGIEFIPDQSLVNNQTIINVRDQINISGFYKLTDQTKKNILSSFSMNYNRSESYLNFYTLADLNTFYKGKTTKVYNAELGSIAIEVKEQNQGILLWKLCLIFALLFLLIEILLIRFWKTSS